MDHPSYRFIPGLDLSERYFHDAIRPILEREFPRLAYSAALIGYGSEVIGCDTPMSRDHWWGPRAILLLPEPDFERTSSAVNAALRAGLPREILGYPTSFDPPDPVDHNRLPSRDRSGPVNHLNTLTTLPAYFERELGPGWRDPAPADWLTFSEHRLLTLTAGRVFHDDLGLGAARERLAFYPHDVWLYLLASEWSAIGQEEPFVGRAGFTGDDLGSRLIATRLVNACMRLAFLLERRYAPYSKWFGTVFNSLAAAPALSPLLARAVAEPQWNDREAALCAAYELLAQRQNELALSPTPVEARCSAFHDRPFAVIHGERIAAALQAAIEDPFLRVLRPFGSVNQFSPSTDLLEEVAALQKLKPLYRQSD